MLGGGRRVSIARLLKRGAERLGLTLKVIGYELIKDVPLAIEGEIVEGLPWADPNITDDVMRVAIQHEVDIILPFADGAAPVAAACKSRLGHVFVPVPDADTSQLLYDRARSAEAIAKAGIPTPRNYSVINAEVPVIAKPRKDSTARNFKVFRNMDSLMALPDLGEYILQEFIEDFDELNADCYVDAQGSLLTCVPVKRIEVIGGEVVRAVTCRIPEVEDICRKVCSSFPLTGPVTVEILFDKRRHRYLVTHITPRMGDSVACSIYAGAPICDYIIRESRGLKLTPCDDWDPGTLMACYRQEAIFHDHNS